MQTYEIPEARWPAKLRAILQDDALEVFLRLPLAYANSYSKIKQAMLRNWGISTQSKIQDILEMNPKSYHTAVQAHAHILEAFQALATDKSLNQFMDALALEMVYKMIAPYIASSVRQLRSPISDQALTSMDDYISNLRLDSSKLWKLPNNSSHRPSQPPRPRPKSPVLAGGPSTPHSSVKPSPPTTHKPQHNLASILTHPKGPCASIVNSGATKRKIVQTRQ